jgi:hypothetical protein
MGERVGSRLGPAPGWGQPASRSGARVRALFWVERSWHVTPFFPSWSSMALPHFGGRLGPAHLSENRLGRIGAPDWGQPTCPTNVGWPQPRAIPFDAIGKKWVRFAVWDSAVPGAFVQPMWRERAANSRRARSAGGWNEQPISGEQGPQGGNERGTPLLSLAHGALRMTQALVVLCPVCLEFAR